MTGLSRPWNLAGLEELLERLAAESRHHLRVRNAFHPRELFEAEEACAVADERGPVQLPHHAPLLRGQAGLFERGVGVVLEQRSLVRDGKAVQEAIEPQPARAALQVEDIGSLELFDALELRIHAGLPFVAVVTASLRHCVTQGQSTPAPEARTIGAQRLSSRSEERRVGKE